MRQHFCGVRHAKPPSSCAENAEVYEVYVVAVGSKATE